MSLYRSVVVARMRRINSYFCRKLSRNYCVMSCFSTCVADMLFVSVEEQVIADLKDFSNNFKVSLCYAFS